MDLQSSVYMQFTSSRFDWFFRKFCQFLIVKLFDLMYFLYDWKLQSSKCQLECRKQWTDPQNSAAQQHDVIENRDMWFVCNANYILRRNSTDNIFYGL